MTCRIALLVSLLIVACGGSPEEEVVYVEAPATGGAAGQTGDVPCVTTCLSVVNGSGQVSPRITYAPSAEECPSDVTDACTISEAAIVHTICAPGPDEPEETPGCPGDAAWSCEVWSLSENGDEVGNVILPGPCSEYGLHSCIAVGQTQCDGSVCGQCHVSVP